MWDLMACTCYGLYNPGCEEHGIRITDRRRVASALPIPPRPSWLQEWVSPPGHCICDDPDCKLGTDRWIKFILRERDDHQVFWCIVHVDHAGDFLVSPSQAEEYRGTFERAKLEIEECMKDGLSFTAIPEWRPLIFLIARVDVKIQ